MQVEKERGEINLKTGDFKKKKKEVKEDERIKLKAGLTVFNSLETNDDDLGVEFLTMESVKSNQEKVIFDELIEKEKNRIEKIEEEKKKREEEMERRKDICFQDSKVSVLVPKSKNIPIVDEDYKSVIRKEIVVIEKEKLQNENKQENIVINK